VEKVGQVRCFGHDQDGDHPEIIVCLDEAAEIICIFLKRHRITDQQVRLSGPERFEKLVAIMIMGDPVTDLFQVTGLDSRFGRTVTQNENINDTFVPI
jgi:hypothetical protein